MEDQAEPTPPDIAHSFRNLGSTAIKVTPVGLGAWQFSEGKGGAIGSWAPLTPEVTNTIVKAAVDGGINWFDTAELYGFGRSEKGLANALQQIGIMDSEVVIATKWNPLLKTARSLKRTLEKRLTSLSPYAIDLHQVHFPISFSSIESQMHAMADLLEANRIRAAGVSNFSAKQMRQAHQTLVKRGFVLASNQVKYSLLDRRIERNGILETAKELGVTIIAYSPLEMGLLTGKFHSDPALLRRRPWGRRLRLGRLIEKSRKLIAVLDTVAVRHGVSVSQVALNWVISRQGHCVVTIPGASKPRHARESAASMLFTLSETDMAIIEEASSQF